MQERLADLSSEQQEPGVTSHRSSENKAASEQEVLHPEERITSLILIRHGHTRATEEGLLYTDPAAELTERGMAQATAIAGWIDKQKPEAVLCSTAKRVVDTANIVATSLELTPEICPGFEEWHVGEWEGRSYLDIKRNSPQEYAQWLVDPIRNRPPGGESIVDLCSRVTIRLETLLITHEKRVIALVTHAGVIRAVLVHALGMSIDNFWRLSIPVGSVSKVDFSRNFATVQFVAWRPEL